MAAPKKKRTSAKAGRKKNGRPLARAGGDFGRRALDAARVQLEALPAGRLMLRLNEALSAPGADWQSTSAFARSDPLAAEAEHIVAAVILCLQAGDREALAPAHKWATHITTPPSAPLKDRSKELTALATGVRRRLAPYGHAADAALADSSEPVDWVFFLIGVFVRLQRPPQEKEPSEAAKAPREIAEALATFIKHFWPKSTPSADRILESIHIRSASSDGRQLAKDVVCEALRSSNVKGVKALFAAVRKREERQREKREREKREREKRLARQRR